MKKNLTFDIKIKLDALKLYREAVIRVNEYRKNDYSILIKEIEILIKLEEEKYVLALQQERKSESEVK